MTGDELRDYYAKAGVCVDVNPDATDEDADEWARMVAKCMEQNKQKETAYAGDHPTQADTLPQQAASYEDLKNSNTKTAAVQAAERRSYEDFKPNA